MTRAPAPQPALERRNRLFAAPYGLCDLPFTGLTLGTCARTEPVPGVVLCPRSTLIGLWVMTAFIRGMKWWRFASQRVVFGAPLPMPERWAVLSGLRTSMPPTAPTPASRHGGVPLVFTTLVKREGARSIAPVVDAMTGRYARWSSSAGLGLALPTLCELAGAGGVTSAIAALSLGRKPSRRSA